MVASEFIEHGGYVHLLWTASTHCRAQPLSDSPFKWFFERLRYGIAVMNNIYSPVISTAAVPFRVDRH